MELMFSGEFPPCPGGIANYMHVRCLHPPRDGLRVLAADGAGSPSWDAKSDLAVRRFPYNHGGGLAIAPRRVQQLWWSRRALHRELRDRRYRLVTANVLFPFGWAAVATKRKGGHRVAVFCHGAELLRAMMAPAARWFYRRAMPAVDMYVANSLLTADTLVSQGWDRRRIRVIPCPIDAQRFHPGIDGGALRNKWTDGGAAGPVMLTVCRLDDMGKGIDTLLGILPRLRQRFPDIRYVVIGEGPLLRQYAAMARELGVEKHFVPAGWVSDEELPQCYAACDLFALMSRRVPEVGYYEGFGIAYREAMACGKPVIVSTEAGFRDYAVHGKTGLLADPRNPDEILRACAQVLHDPAAAECMGQRGAAFAMQEPDWSPLNELA
jgi:phosphatidyl-myo-inositol dimannoside synthase